MDDIFVYRHIWFTTGIWLDSAYDIIDIIPSSWEPHLVCNACRNQQRTSFSNTRTYTNTTYYCLKNVYWLLKPLKKSHLWVLSIGKTEKEIQTNKQKIHRWNAFAILTSYCPRRAKPANLRLKSTVLNEQNEDVSLADDHLNINPHVSKQDCCLNPITTTQNQCINKCRNIKNIYSFLHIKTFVFSYIYKMEEIEDKCKKKC